MELELKFSVAPAVLFLETQLDPTIVGGLNKYLDARHKKGGESFAHKLVGQIAHGEQLKIDTEDALIKPFTQVVANMFTHTRGITTQYTIMVPIRLWGYHLAPGLRFQHRLPTNQSIIAVISSILAVLLMGSYSFILVRLAPVV